MAESSQTHDSQPTLGQLRGLVGQLTSAEKLRLIEEVARSLRDPDSKTSPADRQASLSKLRHELTSLPVRNPDDGRSNRDHDAVLYGDTP